MRYFPLIASLLLLSSCDAWQNTKDQANSMKTSAYQSSHELKEWFLTPPPRKEEKPVASTYCYKVFQDILCYRQPMPGYEDRLVAYQGTNAEPPPPAMMQPLATRENGAGMMPTNRVANAQPVFVEIPADMKDPALENQDKTQMAVPAADAAHETLPDPALAPEL